MTAPVPTTVDSSPPTSPHTHPASPRTSSIEDSSCALRRVATRLRFSRRSNGPKKSFAKLPPPSQSRLEASLSEQSLDISQFGQASARAVEEKGKTILYLAYGSNLCNETFRDKRGIRPLSQINVQVPNLRLTFDLSGIPYTEPCFANSALRDPEEDRGKDGKDKYHKDRWHKGMVGVVYEVTPSDYAHIIATEGGGASYKDILVPCYPLPDGAMVPEMPTTTPFKAHTLFAPTKTPDPAASRLEARRDGRFARPDPSYAQPSARYLKLITDGAMELRLPAEYQAYLRNIRPYTITSTRQKMGQAVMVSVFMPFIFMLFALQQRFQDDKGRTPKWLADLMGMLFVGLWTSYDRVLIKMFGDGERTEGDEEDDGMEDKSWFRRAKTEEGYHKV